MYLLRKSGTLGHFWTRNQLGNAVCLSKKKIDEIWARLENTPQTTLACLAQEAGVSESSPATATKLLKLRPYKTNVVILQPCDPANRTEQSTEETPHTK
jgi:hypothetical protein